MREGGQGKDQREWDFLEGKIASRRAVGMDVGELQERLRLLCERRGWRFPEWGR